MTLAMMPLAASISWPILLEAEEILETKWIKMEHLNFLGAQKMVNHPGNLMDRFLFSFWEKS